MTGWVSILLLTVVAAPGSRIGRRAEALEAERKAAASSSCSARLHAYYNLYRLGERGPVPKLPDLRAYADSRREERICTAVPVERCGPLFACTLVGDVSGSGGTYLSNGVVFGKDEGAMRALEQVGPASQVVLVPQDTYTDDCCHAGQEPCDRGVHDHLDRGRCVVVFADACRLRVGLWCPAAGGEKARARELPSEEGVACVDDPAP
jgi:hypothetical protein